MYVVRCVAIEDSVKLLWWWWWWFVRLEDHALMLGWRKGKMAQTRAGNAKGKGTREESKEMRVSKEITLFSM
jgi:hypothetical protein